MNNKIYKILWIRIQKGAEKYYNIKRKEKNIKSGDETFLFVKNIRVRKFRKKLMNCYLISFKISEKLMIIKIGIVKLIWKIERFLLYKSFRVLVRNRRKISGSCINR
jgi:hypothetical protein